MPDALATADRPLAGRTAVVTGASAGIGRAIASALVSAGVRTWLVARREAVLRDLAATLGPLAEPLPCDVADADAVAAAAATVAEATGGAPDVLVNNAGLFPLATIEATDAATFAAALQVNLLAPFLFARAFLAPMRTRGTGHVVTIGSVADRLTFPENGAYAATKHGQRAFHEVLRQELRGSGIRATLVSPGPVDTPIWDPVDPDHREGFPPRALMLHAEDVADAVLWAVTRPARVNVDEVRLARS